MNKIAFIGAGHMAAALIGGLRAHGVAPKQIVVSARTPGKLAALQAQFGVDTTTDNEHAVKGADVVLLAMKPQDLPDAAAKMALAIQASHPLVVSVAAGVRIVTIEAALQGYAHIVRAMPNRPALIAKGVTALFAAPAVSRPQRDDVQQLFMTAGEVAWLEREELMDAATAVSGSGPAYFFLLTELLEEAAIALGLPAPVARSLSVQTAYGAGCMARELCATGAATPQESTPEQLRKAVTSPGGTTAAALAVLEKADLRGIVHRAVAAAAQRATELAAATPRFAR